MSRDYSENKLVQQSSLALLRDELGWDTALAYNQEVLGEGGTFGRKTYHDVLLLKELKPALLRLNPWLKENNLRDVVEKLEEHLTIASLMQINEDKYKLFREGVQIVARGPKGKMTNKTVRLFDFDRPDNNHFLAVEELKISGPVYNRRADIVGFVNGIPLLFIELKRSDVDIKNAYVDNYRDYLQSVPQLFYYNTFIMLSNGLEAKIGTVGSKYEFFHEWKRLQESDKGSVQLATMLRGVCRKENFLDLLENFILFDHSGGRCEKILARNHQYLGVNEAVKKYRARKVNDGKLGVFWHTQGSGKSYSMIFLARKIRRKFAGSPTIVVLTDRDELNKQISGTFESCGVLEGQKAKAFIASSGEDLTDKLKGNPPFIFTLIQKFNRDDLPPIEIDHEIIIMSDEAHRSQYGVFAANMMKLLPQAARIGFTGTPLLRDDNITQRTFGGYVSVYDFQRAVEDGATVPLYYENRGERLKEIENPQITAEILEAVERADLDPAQEARLEREFAKEIHLLTAEKRLRSIARDFVRHYSDCWTCGKAMFVCLNKVTCVRMWKFVQEYWQEEILRQEKLLKTVSQQEAANLLKKLEWMRATEMCVVISQEQNEQETFAKWGLDILPHREKMQKRELDKDFKDGDNPFRVVFVCAMWLTGFDVKSLACLYLDKPLKAHTLMQAIARANRVAEGKSNGLIIDYIGIVKALRKAMADYTVQEGGRGTDPAVDKEALLRQLAEALARAKKLLADHNFLLEKLVEAAGFDKLELLQDAMEAMQSPKELRKEFFTYAGEIHRLLKYVSHEELDADSRKEHEAVLAIWRQLKDKRAHADNTELMVEINEIINQYVRVEEVVEEPGGYQAKRFDISKIDFDLLAREFARTRRKNLLLKDLDEMVQERLARMLAVNPNRIDYYERYQEIIEEYNKEQDRASIEKTFMDLMKLVNEMSEEEKRYAREGFANDEELSLYDLLFRDDLTKQEIAELKKMATELLKKVKKRIAEIDHWRDKETTRANVVLDIRDVMYEMIPEPYLDSINDYVYKVYAYVYDHYPEAG